MPTTSTNTSAATTNVDMATVANHHSELMTNATPTENLIAGVGGHGNYTQPSLTNPQDGMVAALPPPPHVDRTYYNSNSVTYTRNHRRSPLPSPKGISPVNNPVSNNKKEDLISFDSISSQLIAAANHDPFPSSKPYPNNMLSNEIPPLSASNQSSVPLSGTASLLHSRVNAVTNTGNSSPQTSEDDLIVLDTIKATEISKIKQESLGNNLIGPFEQEMIVVDHNHPSGMSDKSYPHPREVTDTNSSQLRGSVVTGATTNQLTPANPNTLWMWQSSSQQHLGSTEMASDRLSNQMKDGHLSYRDGFGVTKSDVLCTEAIQMWIKAEISLAKGDTAVGLLAYQRVSGEQYLSFV